MARREIPLSVGDTFGDILSWRWNRAARRYETEHHDHELRVQFHKVGGRYSRTLPDGTPNIHGGKGFWTIEVDCDRASTKFATAYEAKTAAVAEYKRRFK